MFAATNIHVHHVQYQAKLIVNKISSNYIFAVPVTIVTLLNFFIVVTIGMLLIVVRLTLLIVVRLTCIMTFLLLIMQLTTFNNYHLLQQLLILLAGDIESNPGPRPPRFPCGECSRACTSYKGAKASILCESCDVWFHSDCVGLTDSALSTLSRSDLPWECYRCGLPNFSSGLFDSTILDGSSSGSSNNETHFSSSSTSSSHPSSPLANSSPNKSSSNNQSFKNLRILEVNFQSIFSKRAEFWSVLEATKPDVVYGCETWLKGVQLAFHSSLKNHQITIHSDSEIVAAKIINDKQSIVLASLYRPTNNDLEYMESLNSAIGQLCKNNPGAVVWIAGDINLNDIEWETHSIASHQYKLAINESFLNLLETAGLEQIVNFPTRGDNTLDVIITNRPSLTNRWSGLPGLSDHDMVYMDANVRAARRKPVRCKILLWKRAGFDSIRSRVHQMSTDFTLKYTTSTPVEDLATALQHELDNIINECVPSKMSTTRSNQPWFNSASKSILRRKARAFKKARRTNKARDWTRFKHLKKEAQKVCQNFYNKYVHDLYQQ